VLSILRTALGLQQSPPNQILIGLSLFLSLFVMAPTLDRVNANAIAPYSAGHQRTQAIGAAGMEFHAFMVRQTRERDLRCSPTWPRRRAIPPAATFRSRSCCPPLSPAS
jgi:flagellar biosynthetic protein FliP